MTPFDRVESIMVEELDQFAFIIADVVPGMLPDGKDGFEISLKNTLNGNKRKFTSTYADFRKTLKQGIDEILR